MHETAQRCLSVSAIHKALKFEIYFWSMCDIEENYPDVALEIPIIEIQLRHGSWMIRIHDLISVLSSGAVSS